MSKPTNPLDIARVLEVVRLYRTPDKRVTKSMIAGVLHLPYTNSHNNCVDRDIRNAITELRKQGHPIISTAGAAGYWYDPASVGIVISDMRSRIIDMSETIRALEHGYQAVKPVQMRMQI